MAAERIFLSSIPLVYYRRGFIHNTDNTGARYEHNVGASLVRGWLVRNAAAPHATRLNMCLYRRLRVMRPSDAPRYDLGQSYCPPDVGTADVAEAGFVVAGFSFDGVGCALASTGLSIAASEEGFSAPPSETDDASAAALPASGASSSVSSSP
jgi:hypothetical protein